MAIDASSVEGPLFAERVGEAEAITRKLEANQWNFDAAPEIFARASSCDVLAKEIAVIHDGRTQTQIGRLVMTGSGTLFNLMGPESATAVFKSVDSPLLDEINRQIGSNGLRDFPEFQKYSKPQTIEFFNFTTFYQLRDIVFWSALKRCGLFPSGLEHFARHIASGRVVHNVLFAPNLVPLDPEAPVIMEARCMMLQFPTPVVEWMDKPLFGGMVRETIHIANLLTTAPTSVSHPYLSLVGEGKVEYGNESYYLRRFAGISPKNALRGPGVAPEGEKRSEAQ
jgi:hypothetical protein